MKKIRFLLAAFVMLLVLSITGCQGKLSAEEEATFEEDLKPLTDEEIAALDNEEMTDGELERIDESELDEGTDESDMKAADSGSAGKSKLKEDGTYTSMEEVSAYINEFGKLPLNYITKKEAQKLGWVSKEGNLDEVAPGKSIGGDHFGNYDKLLPEESGRTYKECDIDFDGGYRSAKRIIYSSDGLVFYTEDHYETFQQLY